MGSFVPLEERVCVYWIFYAFKHPGLDATLSTGAVTGHPVYTEVECLTFGGWVKHLLRAVTIKPEYRKLKLKLMLKNIVDPHKFYNTVKPLTHPGSFNEIEDLEVKRNKLIVNSYQNRNENWFENAIIHLWNNRRFKFRRQYLYGRRIFDFFNEFTGCAVEIDGQEHDPKYDRYRDISVYIYDGIVVYRIRNGSSIDLKEAIGCIMHLDSWEKRKRKLNISRAASNRDTTPKKVKKKFKQNFKNNKNNERKNNHKSDKQIYKLKTKLERE